VGVKGAESGGKLRLLRRPFHPDVQFLRPRKITTCFIGRNNRVMGVFSAAAAAAADDMITIPSGGGTMSFLPGASDEREFAFLSTISGSGYENSQPS
jgi:hypothetical protein